MSYSFYPIKKEVLLLNLHTFLSGRRLLRSEIPFLFEELNQPFIQTERAISFNKGKPQCLRCGNQDRSLFGEHLCTKCQQMCVYCRHCIQLRKVSSCEKLYTWTGPEIVFPQRENSLQWQGQLSTGQAKASAAVVQAIEQNEEILVWAVCGAGKTEVLFRGLEQAFSQGKRVLLSTPRTDVVQELSPRLRRSFPHTHISTLYGGSKDREPGAQLVLSTTHQAMRFYRAFDVVIIDEVDAFPFSYDQSLQWAVSQAKKLESAMIYLSATPSRKLVTTPNLQVIKIPKRFHGHPLPQPRFEWCGNWPKQLSKNKLPPALHHWIQAHPGKPLLLFVPSLSVLKTVSSLLTIPHHAVHSQEPNRHSYVEAFRNGKFHCLLRQRF